MKKDISMKKTTSTKVNDMMARVAERKAESKKKYDAMTPEEQREDDRMWAEVDADKIKHNWRESVIEGSFSTLFKTTGKDNEGNLRHGWSDFGRGRLNRMRERGRNAEAKRKAEYDAMTPEEQKKEDDIWAEVKADKIEKTSRESVDLERWRSALENGKSVVLENEEIISLMRLNEKKDVEPLDEINRTKLKNRLGAEVARVTYGDKKHTPMTNKQAKLLRKLEREENQESEEIDEGKGMGHLQKMFFKKTMQTALPKLGGKLASKFAKSAAKPAKQKRNNQYKVKTKGGGEETVSGEDLKAAGEVYDREDLESRIQRRLGPDNR